MTTPMSNMVQIDSVKRTKGITKMISDKVVRRDLGAFDLTEI